MQDAFLKVYLRFSPTLYISQFGMGILNDMGAVYVTTNTVSCDMTTEEDYDRHGCQMAIAKFSDCMCLALQA